MTNQEIFDKVATHLLRQGAKSMSPNPRFPFMCAYRGKNGMRCALGVLITDEAYDPVIEGGGVLDEGGVKSALQASGVTAINSSRLDLLKDLQAVHDDRPHSIWSNYLLETARKFNLSAEAVLVEAEQS